jgi:hypothetical protein
MRSSGVHRSQKVRTCSDAAPGNSLVCSHSPPASLARSSAGGRRLWRHRRPARVAGDRAAHGIDRGSNAVHGPDKVCLDSFPPILELIADMGDLTRTATEPKVSSANSINLCTWPATRTSADRMRPVHRYFRSGGWFRARRPR